ncbi:MAG: type II toxin-antitoxin system RelB/DinJ family antitoxin [Oscillospiraceae bacterium]|nr:type II toxin-antitoxin system RelB/DinJ family antitoxin [Oscillospiraceae bacterium]
MSIQVSTRIDEATKRQFDSVCEMIGISPSNAISMFIKSVINYNGIPFSAVAPVEKKHKMTMAEMLGCMRGQFKMSDDFDAPLEDFMEYME